MALFRKFFYRKPPDGLLEIVERVYVFDYCFTTDVMEECNYKSYINGIVGQLCGHLPDSSFMVFNFREGEKQSQIGDMMQEHDMTVIDYPRQYEGCPLLTMEMIHHCLKSGDSWLMLSQNNVLLMHCERGGWPILAFMLAALLIYRKLYNGEQKTLDMIHKQAPRELLQLMSPLNPFPSQLRYLQYVSRRNLGPEWPPSDRALTLDCIILRLVPNMDGEGGCRPILRIYGRDPSSSDRTSKMLFSTPKKSRTVRHYKQEECELVKIDVHCHIQGDVVFECISLDDDLEREEMIFRVMFNTAFIRSNILMLNHDEIDILWNTKDRFPKDFRAEILFSEIESATCDVPTNMPATEEKEGLPVEAFAKVKDFFNSIDWDSRPDVTPTVLQQIIKSTILNENMEVSAIEKAEIGILEGQSPEKRGETPKSLLLESIKEEFPSKASEKQSQQSSAVIIDNALIGLMMNSNKKDTSSISVESSETARRTAEPGSPPLLSPERPTKTYKEKLSLVFEKHLTPSSGTEVVDVTPKKTQLEDSVPGLQQSSQTKMMSPRILQSPRSGTGSYSNSPQSSPMVMQRFHGSPSSIGITALLHDDDTYNGDAVAHLVTASPKSSASSVSSAIDVSKIAQKNALSSSIPLSASAPQAFPAPSQPSAELSDIGKTPSALQAKLPSPQASTLESKNDIVRSTEIPTSETSPSKPPLPSSPIARKSQAAPPPPPPPHALPSPSSGQPPYPNTMKPSSAPPPPPPPPSFKQSPSSNICSPLPVPPPPPPPPSPFKNSPPFSDKGLLSPAYPPAPPPPPPLVGNVSSSTEFSSSIPKIATGVKPPPPPPPPNLSTSTSRCSTLASTPPPPPPPSVVSKDVGSTNSPRAPPPPPTPFGKGLVNASSQQPQTAGSNGPIPPPPGPLSAKGRAPPRLTPRSQSQKKANLKPYHWLKLTRVMQGSLWAEAQKCDDASKAPDFDLSELENLFAASVPNSEKGGTGAKSSRRTGPKSDRVQLIELRRAYNCEIMLTKVKIPLPDLMNSVLALDDSALDADQVENLIKFCPTKEEMDLLKGYKGDKENLGKCEQFFLELMKVPRVESKLRVFSFKIQFSSQVSDLRKNLNVVNCASEEIRTSTKLKRIMQTILSLGNALNQGTARGAAVGFRLDSLLKLTDTRARNNKMTLMHYLCKVLAERMPELLDFSKGLTSLETATKIQLKFLAEEMQAISKGLEKVVQELSASGNDGRVSECFCKTLKEFLSSAEDEVRSLASLYSTVGRSADALAMYFGEDPAKCPFEQVVSTLHNFVKMFIRAHDENCKQIEFEKKKAEKEAENERLKTSKEAGEQHVPSPRKFGTVK